MVVSKTTGIGKQFSCFNHVWISFYPFRKPCDASWSALYNKLDAGELF